MTAAPGAGLASTTTSYGYYSSGALASVTYPSYSGQPATPKVTYSYDATGAMTSAVDWLGDQVAFAHDVDGNPTGQDNDVSTSNPTGTSNTMWSYDNADENTGAATTMNQSCGGPETLNHVFNTPGVGSRNADGQLTAFTFSYSGSCSSQTGLARSYSYDKAGRLTYAGSTAASQGTHPNNYGYDPAGDLTMLLGRDPSGTRGTFIQTFDNAGEVTGQAPISGSAGATSSFTYDTLGDQTTVTTAGALNVSQSYDQIGQMTSATTASSTAIYRYNVDGLTAATTVGSATSQYTWTTADGSLALLLSDGANDYIYGPTGEPVEQITLATNTPVYLTYIASSNDWIATNQAGRQAGLWAYDPYGTLVYGTPKTPFGFSGQYTDPTTGLINDRARWYQASDGEFTTVDPDLAATDQPYAYATDNPVGNRDPSGKLSIGICAGGTVSVFAVQFGLGTCLVEVIGGHNNGQVGLVTTFLGGIGVGLGVNPGWYVQVSSADDLNQLKNWFNYVNVSASYVGGFTATAFWSLAGSKPFVVGAEVGPSAGPDVSVFLGKSYTKIAILHGWFDIEGKIGRAAFSYLKQRYMPSRLNSQDLLNDVSNLHSHLNV